MIRRLLRWIGLGVAVLLCSGLVWFATSPQLEVLFARNTLTYRAESWWGAPPPAAQVTGLLSGDVVENSGDSVRPLADATLVVADPMGRTFTTQSVRGQFELAVPPGVYVPVVTKAGYTDMVNKNAIGLSTSLTVAAGQKTMVHFTLRPAPTRLQVADTTLVFHAEAVTQAEVPQPAAVRRRAFSFVRAGTVLTSAYVYEPLAAGRYPILLFVYPCAAYPCSTLNFDILSATMAAQGFVVVAFSPQRGFDLEGDMDDILKLLADIKTGQLSAMGEPRHVALLAGSLTSIHVWRVAQLAPPDTIQAIVTLGGVSDIFLMRQRFEENALDLEPDIIRQLVSSALIGLGRPHVNPELYVRYSVAYHVDALPRIPLALLHGGEDKTVPLEQTPRLAALLAAHGNPYTMYIFPSEEHYLQLSPPTPDEIDMLDKVVQFLRTTFRP